MVDTFEKQINLFDRIIYAKVDRTDDGIQVLLAGGDRSHIGAVAVADRDGKVSTTTFPGHKETIIAEKWADGFFTKYNEPVVVSVGIHYDNITKEQISQVLTETDNLLEVILNER